MAEAKSKSLRLKDVRPDPKPRRPAPVYLRAVMAGEDGENGRDEASVPRRGRADTRGYDPDDGETRATGRRGRADARGYDPDDGEARATGRRGRADARGYDTDGDEARTVGRRGRTEPYGYDTDSDEARTAGRRKPLPDGKTEEEAAYDAALKILSYGANTRNRLLSKLTERGFSEEAAASACERLTASGLLNDRRELDGAVMNLARRFGPERIPQELKRLGFEDELIEAVDYEALGIDFAALCRRVIERKGYSERTAAYLRSRGFPVSLIRRAAKGGDTTES